MDIEPEMVLVESLSKICEDYPVDVVATAVTLLSAHTICLADDRNASLGLFLQRLVAGINAVSNASVAK